MKQILTVLTALLLSPLDSLNAADAPEPPVKVTQELLNSIHVTMKLTLIAKLTAFFSTDDGKTWSGGVLLDERNIHSCRRLRNRRPTTTKRMMMSRRSKDDLVPPYKSQPCGVVPELKDSR